jgi:hypothetical protein
MPGVSGQGDLADLDPRLVPGGPRVLLPADGRGRRRHVDDDLPRCRGGETRDGRRRDQERCEPHETLHWPPIVPNPDPFF